MQNPKAEPQITMLQQMSPIKGKFSPPLLSSTCSSSSSSSSSSSTCLSTHGEVSQQKSVYEASFGYKAKDQVGNFKKN